MTTEKYNQKTLVERYPRKRHNIAVYKFWWKWGKMKTKPPEDMHALTPIKGEFIRYVSDYFEANSCEIVICP